VTEGNPLAECARCGKPAPVSPGRPDWAAQGWRTIALSKSCVIWAQSDDSEPAQLQLDDVRHLAKFLHSNPEGPVTVVTNTGRAVPAVVTARPIHFACGDCQRETGWDDFQWQLFLAGLALGGDDDAQAAA
jgi:hypothetical protein